MATTNEQHGHLPGLQNHISQPVYSPAVPRSLIDTINKPTAESRAWPKLDQEEPNALSQVEVRPITDPAHPACGQCGLFATRDLGPSTFVLFYLGRVHLNEPDDTDAESDYDLSFDRELGVSIDARHDGNEARYMNDYRGVCSAGANVEFRDCWVGLKAASPDGKATWERRMGIFVLSQGKTAQRKTGIRRGDEILINYGRTFWSGRKATARDE